MATSTTDTSPAFSGDEMFPYVGKSVANLTLAQIKTLDCGSERLDGFPLQLEYPGIKLSTLQELFVRLPFILACLAHVPVGICRMHGQQDSLQYREQSKPYHSGCYSCSGRLCESAVEDFQRL